MVDVRGDFLGPPHGTKPAAVIENKTDKRKMDYVRGDCLGPPHATIPAAVIKSVSVTSKIQKPKEQRSQHSGKVQVGKDQEKAQSERFPLQKPRRQKPN